MARILPDDWQVEHSFGARARAAETLTRFAHALPDNFTVFHGVHWSRPDKGIAQLGDIDFVVVAPSGRVLLVEQKTGLLEETGDGLMKRSVGREITVRVHVDRTLDGLQRRLAPLRQGEPTDIQYLLYCPDYRVKQPGTAGLAPAQIVDSASRDLLCRRVLDSLGDEPPQPALTLRLHRFFANELDLVPDASALVGRATELYTRLSEGLAIWARRIQLSPHRLRVSATAGSGKTQLALALLHDAAQRGQRALFVCFNRPLADHIASLLPEAAGAHDERAAPKIAANLPAQGALALNEPEDREPEPPLIRVVTYHQWCAHRLREAGASVDFSDPEVYRHLAQQSAALAVREADKVDCLIIDEGQDFYQSWFDDLIRLANRDASVWWLEDPMQNLYRREPVELPGWVRLHTEVNYRSPHAVVESINRLLSPVPAVVAGGPLQGQAPDWLIYADHEELLTRTKAAITLALRRGFRREDIALITMSGRGRSALLAQTRLGPHSLRAFTGHYDTHGHPRYSRGELLIDTVFRFKGQSAPCVILTEVDFEALDEMARQKLFVGMTRASMHLIMVVAVRVATILDPDGLHAGPSGTAQKDPPK